jgi:hypothetical protein
MVPPDTHDVLTKFPLPDPAFDYEYLVGKGVPGAVSVSDNSSSTSISETTTSATILTTTAATATTTPSRKCDDYGDEAAAAEEEGSECDDGLRRIPEIIGQEGSFTRKFSSERFSSSASTADGGSSIRLNDDDQAIEPAGEAAAVPQENRAVRFGDIEINEHAMILGDHPDVMEGPPVSLFIAVCFFLFTVSSLL